MQIDDASNQDDSDLFTSWRDGRGGVGVSENYDGDVMLEIGKWHRLAIVVDMLGDHPTIRKYIDGVKHSDQVEARGIGKDGRYSLEPSFLLFTDDSGETLPGAINSLQLYDRCLTSTEVRALGGPSSMRLPISNPGLVR